MRLLCCAGAALGEEVFGPRRELTGVQPLVDALGGSRAVAVAGAAVFGAASVAGVAAVNSVVPEVAAVGLHNYVAGCDDPNKLESGEVEAIASK
ncbi:hypothetical protein E2562_025423 [Oryza meyeriana var. granulata]|uniref:Uncharacterized protein n=1 Tax=Oryza meyeriana var. granulata TaxID=110450 RepID=A0A6G1D7P9_9ORYZ|nr:hypothetical protein E2562_025423 [Oryza meyeriana var. granulata]